MGHCWREIIVSCIMFPENHCGQTMCGRFASLLGVPERRPPQETVKQKLQWRPPRTLGMVGPWDACWGKLNVRREAYERQGLCVLQAAELGKGSTQPLWDQIILSQAPDTGHSCRIWHLPCWVSVFRAFPLEWECLFCDVADWKCIFPFLFYRRLKLRHCLESQKRQTF